MANANLALSELLGAPVTDPSGTVSGRVRELALSPQEDAVKISLLVVKTRHGERALVPDQIARINSDVRSRVSAAEWHPFAGPEGYFLLDRDLLDQQIIDINGRKVVRVNDVEILL